MEATSQAGAVTRKKVCMLGAFGVGKTSLVRQYVESLFDEKYHTTVGIKIDKKSVGVAGRQVMLMLWDFAGKDQFSDILPSHLRGAAGYILVVDPTRGHSLGTALELHAQMRETLGAIPCVVALNKSDLGEDWELAPHSVDDAFPDVSTVIRTSAKTGAGVDGMFLALAREMLA